MAENQAISFFEEISKNKKLAEEVNKVVGGNLSDEAKANKILSLVKEQNFNFTPEDVVNAGEKLSLDDLSEVSGGKGGLKSGLMAMALLAGGMGVTGAATTLMSDAAIPAEQHADAPDPMVELGAVRRDLDSAFAETEAAYRTLSAALEDPAVQRAGQGDERYEDALQLLQVLRTGTPSQLRAGALAVPAAVAALSQLLPDQADALAELAAAKDELQSAFADSSPRWCASAAGRRFRSLAESAGSSEAVVALRRDCDELRAAAAACRADVARYRPVEALYDTLAASVEEATDLAESLATARADEWTLCTIAVRADLARVDGQLASFRSAIDSMSALCARVDALLASLDEREWSDIDQRALDDLLRAGAVVDLHTLGVDTDDSFSSVMTDANDRLDALRANGYDYFAVMLSNLCDRAVAEGVSPLDAAVVTARELVERLCAGPADRDNQRSRAVVAANNLCHAIASVNVPAGR